jgi:hypothetical protein
VRSPDSSPTLPLGRVIAVALDKHHLGARSRGDDVSAIMEDLLGLHATVPSSPDLQLRARMPTFARARLDELSADRRGPLRSAHTPTAPPMARPTR